MEFLVETEFGTCVFKPNAETTALLQKSDRSTVHDADSAVQVTLGSSMRHANNQVLTAIMAREHTAIKVPTSSYDPGEVLLIGASLDA